MKHLTWTTHDLSKVFEATGDRRLLLESLQHWWTIRKGLTVSLLARVQRTGLSVREYDFTCGLMSVRLGLHDITYQEQIPGGLFVCNIGIY